MENNEHKFARCQCPSCGNFHAGRFTCICKICNCKDAFKCQRLGCKCCNDVRTGSRMVSMAVAVAR